jgi:hypothetical protein
MKRIVQYRKACRNEVPWVGASEIRIASLLIGSIEVAWSITGVVPALTQSLFSSRLHKAGMGDEWFLIMMLVGLLTCAGSVLPWRSGRHIGLFLSTLVWAVMTGIFIDMILASPVTATMPIFASFSVGCMYADAKRKPREKLDP